MYHEGDQVNFNLEDVLYLINVHCELLDEEESTWLELDEQMTQERYNEVLALYNSIGDKLDMLKKRPDEYLRIFAGPDYIPF
jgi:hypothetical protein